MNTMSVNVATALSTACIASARRSARDFLAGHDLRRTSFGTKGRWFKLEPATADCCLLLTGKAPAAPRSQFWSHPPVSGIVEEPTCRPLRSRSARPPTHLGSLMNIWKVCWLGRLQRGLDA